MRVRNAERICGMQCSLHIHGRTYGLTKKPCSYTDLSLSATRTRAYEFSPIGDAMTGPICRWCGGYVTALPDDHDEDACYWERQQEINHRGAAAARAAIKPGPEESSDE